MAYTQSNTDPISVNGMFLKFYLDVMLGMTTTFQEQNLGAFNLYAYYLRACVPSKARRDAVDAECEEMQRRVENGEFGEQAKKQIEFLRGFCVVTASVNFLNDAFKITMNDSTALADTTDDDILLQLEKVEMYKAIHQSAHEFNKKKRLETKVFNGEITSIGELLKELKGDGNGELKTTVEDPESIESETDIADSNNCGFDDAVDADGEYND